MQKNKFIDTGRERIINSSDVILRNCSKSLDLPLAELSNNPDRRVCYHLGNVVTGQNITKLQLQQLFKQVSNKNLTRQQTRNQIKEIRKESEHRRQFPVWSKAFDIKMDIDSIKSTDGYSDDDNQSVNMMDRNNSNNSNNASNSSVFAGSLVDDLGNASNSSVNMMDRNNSNNSNNSNNASN